MVPLLFALLLGCPHSPALVQPSPSAPSIYKIAVAVATDARSITALYTLEATPHDDGVWALATTHSEGAWEVGETHLEYDSAAPRPGDPWPLLLQHAVASVPALVRFEPSGGPMGLVEERSWRMAAMRAVAELELPAEAMEAGTNLLDPVGYVRDLQRSFPGTPPEGLWVREETIAGLPARRVESCVLEEVGKLRTWTCEGNIEGPESGDVRLVGSESRTSLVADQRGLVRLESAHAATLVHVDREGAELVDRPVAGHRLVVRQ